MQIIKEALSWLKEEGWQNVSIELIVLMYVNSWMFHP